jgi:chaperonin GroEL
MHATRAAGEVGIGPGGGVALLRGAEALAKVTRDDPDEMSGIKTVRRALEEPQRWIAQTAGHEGSNFVEKVRANKEANYGFNAQTEEYEDLVKAGVIDPAKVTRTALQNAASIAALMLTTEATISDIPDEKKAAPAPAGHEDF